MQFKQLFEKLDFDRDGKINYHDFQRSVGNEISPPEFLYFRQDNPPPKPELCKHAKCWEKPIGAGRFC